MAEPDAGAKAGSPDGITSWFLLEGNRLVIAAGVIFASLLTLLIVLWRYGLDTVDPHSPMYFLYGSLLTGDLTLLTVVLSINQLVLSRELGAPGTLRERIERTVSYRGDVEATTDVGVSPKSPSRFLQHLHESVADQSEELEQHSRDVDDAAVPSRIARLVESIREDTNRVNRTLDTDRPQIFQVVSATLATNHSSQLHEVAEILDAHAGSLTDEQVSALETIADQLLQIDVARKYFRTIYVQKELAYLSRVLLYVGVPAIVASGLALVLYNTANVTTVAEGVFVTMVAVTFALGYAPLAIVFSFVLRLAWIGQKMASVAPFAAQSEYRP